MTSCEMFGDSSARAAMHCIAAGGHEYVDGYDPSDLDTLVKVCDLCGHIGPAGHVGEPVTTWSLNGAPIAAPEPWFGGSNRDPQWDDVPTSW